MPHIDNSVRGVDEMGSLGRLLTATTLVALGMASSAGAATRTVTAGPPPTAAGKLQALATDVNDYFPHRSTIRVGDKLRFLPMGFHDVNLPEGEASGVPLLVPTGQQANVNDEAGNPFWFNGQPVLGFNPELLDMKWGTSTSFDGSEARGSGLPLADKPGPFTVKFTKKGRFTFLCDVHPGMDGVVKVRPRKASVPSAKKHAKAVKKQVRRDLAIAEELQDATIPANTIALGVAGRYGVERFALVPSSQTIAAGGTLTFAMDPESFEVHTATTGPGDPEAGTGYLGELASSFQAPAIDPRAIYPSSPPGEAAPVSSTAHGNGFANTGVLDTVEASPPPAASTMRLDQPGTYTFNCLVHPFMKATVTAT